MDRVDRQFLFEEMGFNYRVRFGPDLRKEVFALIDGGIVKDEEAMQDGEEVKEREIVEYDRKKSFDGILDVSGESGETSRNCIPWRNLCCGRSYAPRQAMIDNAMIESQKVAPKSPPREMRTVGTQFGTPLGEWVRNKPKINLSQVQKAEELVSRRGDIPMVHSSARTKCRENHQYYRANWGLKPSVIDVSDTVESDKLVFESSVAKMSP